MVSIAKIYFYDQILLDSFSELNLKNRTSWVGKHNCTYLIMNIKESVNFEIRKPHSGNP